METRNDLLKKQAERQDRMLDLLQHCSKISTGIDNLASNSGDRAIWELVQNAKDLSGECHICMLLSKDKFVFKHNGTPFNLDGLLELMPMYTKEEMKSYLIGLNDGWAKLFDMLGKFKIDNRQLTPVGNYLSLVYTRRITRLPNDFLRQIYESMQFV